MGFPQQSSDGRAVPTQEIDRELSELIGARLKAARQLGRRSQMELAEALGVTFQQVQKYESGANRISAPMLIRAARFLEQPIDFFTDADREDVAALEGLGRRDIDLARHASHLPERVIRVLNDLVKTVASRPSA